MTRSILNSVLMGALVTLVLTGCDAGAPENEQCTPPCSSLDTQALQQLTNDQLFSRLDTDTQLSTEDRQAIIDVAISQYANDARFWVARSQLYQQQGQRRLALADITRAVQLDPLSGEYLVLRAKVYRLNGELAATLRDLDQAIEVNPLLADAWQARGELRFSQAEYQQALQNFNRAIALEPALTQAWYNRANTHHVMGNQQKAVADLEQFLALESDPSRRLQAENLLSQW